MKAVFFVLVVIGLSSLAAADVQPTQFKITTMRADLTVEVRADQDKAVGEIRP